MNFADLKVKPLFQDCALRPALYLGPRPEDSIDCQQSTVVVRPIAYRRGWGAVTGNEAHLARLPTVRTRQPKPPYSAYLV